MNTETIDEEDEYIVKSAITRQYTQQAIVEAGKIYCFSMNRPKIPLVVELTYLYSDAVERYRYYPEDELEFYFLAKEATVVLKVYSETHPDTDFVIRAPSLVMVNRAKSLSTDFITSGIPKIFDANKLIFKTKKSSLKPSRLAMALINSLNQKSLK